MFATDIHKLLEPILSGQICTEPFHGLVVAVFGSITALPIMSSQLIQLSDKGLVDTRVFICLFQMNILLIHINL